MIRRFILSVLSAIILSVSIMGCGNTKTDGNVAEKETTKEIITTEEITTAEIETTTEDNSITETETANKPSTSVKVGDYITFGTYEQNNVDDGKEKIEWKVLDIKDGKALIISKYCLHAQRYTTEYKYVTWENCSLRKWLNEEFYNDAFTAEEKLSISETSIFNSNNPKWGTDGGNNTRDKVFLLSIEEVNEYFGSDEDRIATNTEYTTKKGSWMSEAHSSWWLRSPGNISGYSATIVSGKGSVSDFGHQTYNNTLAVRPALWIELEKEITQVPTEKPAVSVKIGDFITFGSYEQNNVGAEKIEWEILDIKDGKALIISKYCLDCQPYNEKDKGVTWESCTLRNWLNEVFYNTAFTAEDRLRIRETIIINEDNPNYGTEGGNNTSDKVFILSVEEVKKYFKYTDDRKATSTEYTLRQGANINDNGESLWWLRSPGGGRANALCVSQDGNVNYNGFYVDYDKGTVRPVLWIDYESIKPEEISQQVTETPIVKPTTSVKVGDYITFGTYEQNDVDDGTEEIEWKVIDVKEGKALIISKYCLDAKPYDSEHTSYIWKNCTLRTWLNEEFYDIAFTTEDKLRISEESVDDTKDKVFLLNIEEVNKYFSNDEDRIATSTVYAINQRSEVSSDNGGSWWWLRTSSSDSYRVPYVMAYGGVNDYGSNFDGILNASGDVIYGRIAVRPALWIDIET